MFKSRKLKKSEDQNFNEKQICFGTPTLQRGPTRTYV